MSLQLNKKLAIIGGGPAGMAAALAAKEAGISDIVILERNHELGGILQQCIHNGFGLHRFGEELTGPEYAERFIDEVANSPIQVLLNTMVVDLQANRTIIAISPQHGVVTIQADAVILAMGCRERTRGAINIPGTRPAGIFTAGTAQRYINIEGFMPGRRAVILGSGDIGLIMARRLTLEGAEVAAVVELMPYHAGLTRNVVQCLEDFDIPLLLRSTVTRIHGRDRLEGVTVSQVDDTRRPIPGTERYINCDTLLLSVGLIPENELSQRAGIAIDPVTGGPQVDETRLTSVPGIFACGNVLQVHDLVDYVSDEAELAGRAAANYLAEGGSNSRTSRSILPGKNVRYVVPQRLSTTDPIDLYLRVEKPAANVEIRIGGIRRCRRNRVVPSEMIKVSLTASFLAKLADKPDLSVDVIQGGGTGA